MIFTIAIDGPAAAGKGTLGRALSQATGFPILDTGLLYRATAARVAEGEDPIAAARGLAESDLARDGLRTARISQEASRVSAIPEVRAALLDFQKTFARREGGAILDGRDIGTVICPEAEMKIFLTASAEARARRRHAEMRETGEASSYDEVLAEMRERDARDSGRDTAPLTPAADAMILETDDMTIDEVVGRCVAALREVVHRNLAAQAR